MVVVVRQGCTQGDHNVVDSYRKRTIFKMGNIQQQIRTRAPLQFNSFNY